MKFILLTLFVAGCAPTLPVFKPVTVDMPVAVPCATAPVTPPDFALSHSAPNDSLFDKTRAALAELDQRKAYEAELQAQSALCR